MTLIDHSAGHTSSHGTGHIDGARWPDVARMPEGHAHAAVARALFNRVTARLQVRVVRLQVRVVTADGHSWGGGGGGAPRLLLHRPGDFYRRLGTAGLIGFGESYMAGDWDTDDLPGLLTVFAAHVATIVPPRLQWLRRWYVPRMPPAEDGSPDGARRNIQRHYDLSNELFALFLDDTMTYSAAEFEDVGGSLSGPLAEAQRRKIDRILDFASVGHGSRVLEIGTGWGELAIRAASRGARVDSITLSQRQRQLALERAARAGVADRVAIGLRDYRDATGNYDAIVSVEMIEAVGDRYWPVFFAALARLLAPGGRIGLQAITMPHHRMLATRNSYTWIHKYIFPGGVIPSVRAVERTAAQASVRVTAERALGPHYARTLQLWRERFCLHTSEISALGFDEVFRRMWTFYLAYAEAGFRAGYLNVHQFTLAHGS